MDESKVLRILRAAERARDFADCVDACVEEMDPEDAAVLQILLEEDEKIMRICEELDVAQATAYRRKYRAIKAFAQLFRENRVRNLRDDSQEDVW